MPELVATIADYALLFLWANASRKRPWTLPPFATRRNAWLLLIATLPTLIIGRALLWQTQPETAQIAYGFLAFSVSHHSLLNLTLLSISHLAFSALQIALFCALLRLLQGRKEIATPPIPLGRLPRAIHLLLTLALIPTFLYATLLFADLNATGNVLPINDLSALVQSTPRTTTLGVLSLTTIAEAFKLWRGAILCIWLTSIAGTLLQNDTMRSVSARAEVAVTGCLKGRFVIRLRPNSNGLDLALLLIFWLCGDIWLTLTNLIATTLKQLLEALA